MTPLLFLAGAAAAEPTAEPPWDISVGGDVKSFFVGSFPYDNEIFMPDGPQATASLDGRLKLDAGLALGGVQLDLQVHQAINALSSPPPTLLTSLGGESGGVGFGSTSGAEPPQAVDLSWELVGVEGDAGNLGVTTRTDRLALDVSIPHADLTIGRQPITFGRALFFTPLDLVNPFSPTVIDQEYKPGADAIRLDGYMGMATTGTLVVAYGGDWDLEGMVGAAYGQTTVGVWDLGLFAGAVHGDGVLGLTGSGSIGPVGLRAEATGTLPALMLDEESEEDPFVRAVVGGDVRPTGKMYVSGEVYLQTNGATDPADYLSQAGGKRIARGELWTLGRTYAGLSVSQEIVPTVTASVFVVANLEDPSALVGPGLAWSVAENASVGAGVFAGLGERPADVSLDELLVPPDPKSLLTIDSEFGLVPTVGYVQVASYF